jgi:SAM-dependent MidA family methyltransferase
MDWVLHDPDHGAYGAGRLRIGPRGDFATAPSLGPDFAALLVPQLAQWLGEIDRGEEGKAGNACGDDPPRSRRSSHCPLALVETGPGEGDLALQLAQQLTARWPHLAARTELVLVEPNAGMIPRQRERLRGSPLPVRWANFDELAGEPVTGVVLAHEVLDALPVERIVRVADGWACQRVALRGGTLGLESGEPLPSAMAALLEPLGLLPINPQRPEGWCTELHTALAPWMGTCASALARGHLLVIDYAMEAWRYYSPARSSGTLMAYRDQRVSADPLLDPGHWDLTAHLCIDSLLLAARSQGWQALGHCRQGQALLALGLAQRLHGLQGVEGLPDPGREPGSAVGNQDLATLLSRREALLRLVDPTALGDFRWMAFRRGPSGCGGEPEAPLFLRDPG